MKVTVCQLREFYRDFADDWRNLAAHVKQEQSNLLVLPEMPFHEWLFAKRDFDYQAWQNALRAHDEWESRLSELAPTNICGTRPVDFGNERYNEAFVYDAERGARSVHVKAHVPNEDGAWEANWYSQPAAAFEPITLSFPHIAREASVGFLIGGELWAMEQAKLYGMEGVQLLAVPRATSRDIADKWLAGGRTAAVVAGAYVASSNRAGNRAGSAVHFAGGGWIIGPEGKLLAQTSDDQPFATVWLDLRAADVAKRIHSRTMQTPPTTDMPRL